VQRRAVWAAPFGFLLASGLFSGCVAALVPEHQELPPPPVTLTVEITGTPGVAFEGSIGTAPSTTAIAGQVPARYPVQTTVAVAVSVTKTQEDGELAVRVWRADQEVARRATSAPYGSVLVVVPAPR